MFDYSKCFQDQLDLLEQEGRYRRFVDIERLVGQFPEAEVRYSDTADRIEVWCSNDYLGMGQNPKVLAAMHRVLDLSGAGSGGSRNISGTNHHHVLLERELADLHGKPSALLFSSAFNANEATLAALTKMLPNPVFFSDELNHASIIQGLQIGHPEKHVFRHNDLAELDGLLTDAGRDRPKVIVVEALYSMEGDIAPFADIVELAQRHGALIYLDEVHSVGIYGPQGAGLAAAAGLADEIHIIQGTLAKAYGVLGGYITGQRDLIDAVRSIGIGFIFTTSLPPVIAAGCLEAVRHLRTSEEERDTLHKRSYLLRQLLADARIRVASNDTHVTSVMVGDPWKCRKIAEELLHAHHIYVAPINAPSVPAGTERLRINPTPLHTEQQVGRLVELLDELWDKFELPRNA